jgi:hypothetical protein
MEEDFIYYNNRKYILYTPERDFAIEMFDMLLELKTLLTHKHNCANVIWQDMANDALSDIKSLIDEIEDNAS